MINIPKGYRLTGKYRLIGAIGKFESFSYRVFAGSAKRAYNQAREELYKTHETIIVEKLEKYNKKTRKWITVKPSTYLH